MARSTVYTVFTNPFYYGEYEYPVGSNEWYVGKHEPMVTRDEYDRVQILLGRKGSPRPQVHLFSFTGLIRCGECGCLVTAEHKTKIGKKTGQPLIYDYYRCTKKKQGVKCSQRYIEVGELEKQIDEQLSHIQIPETLKEWALVWLNKTNDSEVDERQKVLNSVQSAYKAAQEDIDELGRMRMRKLVEDDEYLRQKAKLLKERNALKKNLADVEQRADKWLSYAEETFNFACYARFWFDKGDSREKRIIFSKLGSNFLLKDRKLYLDKKKQYMILQKAAEKEAQNFERLEPDKKTITIRKSTDLAALNLRLCRESESNRHSPFFRRVR